MTAWTESENVAVFLGAGLLTLWVRGRHLPAGPGALRAILPWPLWLIAGAKGPATAGTLAEILWFFTKAGAFVFGSGLAIVPFLYGGVVQERGWLTDRQFLDAVAVAMITPGPVVITVGFIGYLTAGLAGAVLAAIGTFVPCYFLTVIPAPYFKARAADPRLRGFVDGVTAAATGAIAGAAYVLGRRALVDLTSAAIAAAALAVSSCRWRVPEPLLILTAGVLGWVVR